MNAAQRRVHANAWTVLGGLLLVMLAIAVAGRPTDATASSSSRAPQRTP